MTKSRETGNRRENKNRTSGKCGHRTLAKVESKIKDADTDVQIYVCTICGKVFPVNAW